MAINLTKNDLNASLGHLGTGDRTCKERSDGIARNALLVCSSFYCSLLNIQILHK